MLPLPLLLTLTFPPLAVGGAAAASAVVDGAVHLLRTPSTSEGAGSGAADAGADVYRVQQLLSGPAMQRPQRLNHRDPSCLSCCCDTHASHPVALGGRGLS